MCVCVCVRIGQSLVVSGGCWGGGGREDGEEERGGKRRRRGELDEKRGEGREKGEERDRRTVAIATQAGRSSRGSSEAPER